MNLGLKQLSKPTPESINTIVHTVSAVFAIVVAAVSRDQHIPQIFKDEFALWGGCVVAVLQAIRPFFGVPVDASVPSEKVSAINKN